MTILSNNNLMQDDLFLLFPYIKESNQITAPYKVSAMHVTNVKLKTEDNANGLLYVTIAKCHWLQLVEKALLYLSCVCLAIGSCGCISA